MSPGVGAVRHAMRGLRSASPYRCDRSEPLAVSIAFLRLPTVGRRSEIWSNRLINERREPLQRGLDFVVVRKHPIQGGFQRGRRETDETVRPRTLSRVAPQRKGHEEVFQRGKRMVFLGGWHIARGAAEVGGVRRQHRVLEGQIHDSEACGTGLQALGFVSYLCVLLGTVGLLEAHLEVRGGARSASLWLGCSPSRDAGIGVAAVSTRSAMSGAGCDQRLRAAIATHVKRHRVITSRSSSLAPLRAQSRYSRRTRSRRRSVPQGRRQTT